MKKHPEENLDPIPRDQPLGIDKEIPDGGESSQGEEWAPTAKENPRPLIPEGVYEAMCVRQKKKYNALFKREILTLRLQLFEGPCAGTIVERFYSVTKFPGRGSSFYLEWTIANGGKAPRRGDRLSTRKFDGKVFKVSVKTVSKNWNRRLLPQALQYSKADAILELVVTNERTN